MAWRDRALQNRRGVTALLRGATLINGTGRDPRPTTTIVLEGNRVVA
jgi:hypothetical protein